ncbi:DUF4167 domain-containing protein [Brevundimonas goettingensis]|uniref:DUF4167 domain-containing protein n=2 Tax=Brevundimonas goettingensis TaxID=2774190 RepID=A0A975C454_9CAUL|nr:DUF4167 domain-containing protein [Brevundimonas goettingensis]
MRDFKGMKRQRGRNRKPGGGQSNANNANPNRSWDSQGPENIKVRGNAQTVYERYLQLGRDATASGDRVLAENYLQHAEHYFRVLRALQPARPVSEIAARELSNQGFDIDFEDETGAQAAAFLAAQQAADRAAQQANEPRENDRQDGQPREQNQNRDRDQNRGEGGQQREWRDRDNNKDRDNNRDRDQQQPRAEGEEGGPRRETRRERWERRREERNRRFEAEGGVGEAPDNAPYDAGADSAADAQTAAPAEALTGTPYEPAADDAPKAQRPRRNRMPREGDADDAPAALPGFLTRSSAPAAPAVEAPVAAASDEEPAPKKRAPRRKAETAAEE